MSVLFRPWPSHGSPPERTTWHQILLIAVRTPSSEVISAAFPLPDFSIPGSL